MCFHFGMTCAECDAFRAAHNMAIMRYSDAMQSLHEMASNGEFRSQKYQRLKIEAEDARAACEMANAALQAHREGHRTA